MAASRRCGACRSSVAGGCGGAVGVVGVVVGFVGVDVGVGVVSLRFRRHRRRSWCLLWSSPSKRSSGLSGPEISERKLEKVDNTMQ